MKKTGARSTPKNQPEGRRKQALTISYERVFEISSMQEALRPFGVALTPALAVPLRRYIELLLRWNQKINLTATSDVGEILRRHVGESLFGATLLPDTAGTLCDVGSGAGFPGLMLKLVRPDWQLVLVESDHRKAAFLSEALRVLDVSGTKVLSERYDQLKAESFASGLNVITARAIGEYDRLLAWAKRSMVPSGRVLLWLGTSEGEKLTRIKDWLFEATLPIPESRERVVTSGRSVHVKSLV